MMFFFNVVFNIKLFLKIVLLYFINKNGWLTINVRNILGGNHLEKARNSLNEALDTVAKKEQKKAELATENDVLNLWVLQ